MVLPISGTPPPPACSRFPTSPDLPPEADRWRPGSQSGLRLSEGHGGLVSRLITLINHIVTPIIPVINLLTESAENPPSRGQIALSIRICLGVLRGGSSRKQNLFSYMSPSRSADAKLHSRRKLLNPELLKCGASQMS